MNALFSLGLILLFALLAGHLVKQVRVPEVTGYILAGVVVGPSVLGWLDHANLAALSVFSEVVLGLILFSIGSVFEFGRVRSLGPAVLRVTAAESLAASLLVFSAMLALGQDWRPALLLGAIAMETAAASTLMVIKECNASGPLSDTLLGIIGLNNVFCLVAFSAAGSIVDFSNQLNAGPFLETFYRSAFPLFWQLAGSAALGYLVGVLLSSWASKVAEHGEALILLIGCVLLCVGAALVLELSPLVASLSVGATMANLSANSRRMFQAISRTDPPLYAIFFVIAGADLNLGLLKTMGALGLVYICCRAGGKFLGAKLGARHAGLQLPVRRYLGYSLMSHAGLAVGLTLTVGRRFPDLAPVVATVVLAAVAVYEVVGPLGARIAIVRAGEARRRQSEPGGAAQALEQEAWAPAQAE